MDKESILLVDDDPGGIATMGRALSGLAELHFSTNGQDALRVARECTPDVIVLDAEMPGMNGFQTCEAIKADAALVDIPVIFVTSHSGPEFEAAGFEAGAVDFIAKPIKPHLVRARVTAQLRAKRAVDELRRKSLVDPLTSVANRRRFDEEYAREWLRARRDGEPVSLLMVDVDSFKAFNDNYGHPAGDACLRQIAGALQRTAQRPADLVARYGGEEFAVLLPGTDRAGAEHLAFRLLGAIEALGIPHAFSATARHVTASIGISSYDASSDVWLEASDTARQGIDAMVLSLSSNLLLAADQALYGAKHAGRAQARFLDVANAYEPARAREISAAARDPRG
jgi:diguanylate cyclase (GGDEF)-like protein